MRVHGQAGACVCAGGAHMQLGRQLWLKREVSWYTAAAGPAWASWLEVIDLATSAPLLAAARLPGHTALVWNMLCA